MAEYDQDESSDSLECISKHCEIGVGVSGAEGAVREVRDFPACHTTTWPSPRLTRQHTTLLPVFYYHTQSAPAKITMIAAATIMLSAPAVIG